MMWVRISRWCPPKHVSTQAHADSRGPASDPDRTARPQTPVPQAPSTASGIRTIMDRPTVKRWLVPVLAAVLCLSLAWNIRSLGTSLTGSGRKSFGPRPSRAISRTARGSGEIPGRVGPLVSHCRQRFGCGSLGYPADRANSAIDGLLAAGIRLAAGTPRVDSHAEPRRKRGRAP